MTDKILNVLVIVLLAAATIFILALSGAIDLPHYPLKE